MVGVCQSVGLGGALFTGKGDGKLGKDHDFLDGDDEEDPDLIDSMDDSIPEEFPTFFGSELAESLVTARRSLILLRAAQPDHPLLSDSAGLAGRTEWLWSENEIEAAWAGTGRGVDERVHDIIIPEDPSPVRNAYHPELADQFKVFDLEPGTLRHLPSSSPNKPTSTLSTSLSVPIQTFISQFPVSIFSLHPLTPTLAHLNALTFAPLLSHTSKLSHALLELFLPTSSLPSLTSNLNFREHATLLRSYLLFTSPAFKSGLAAALFSDSGVHIHNTSEVDFRTRSRRLATQNIYETDNDDRQWAVGLAPALTDRESWPPGGADLSFMLRTVIVDSLEWECGLQRNDENGDNEGVRVRKAGKVLEEAEYRLGFAIRDLPVGAGRDKWLNPTC